MSVGQWRPAPIYGDLVVVSRCFSRWYFQWAKGRLAEVRNRNKSMADELAIREQRNKDMEEQVQEMTRKRDELLTARKVATPKALERDRLIAEIRDNREKRARMLEARVADVGGAAPGAAEREAKEKELAQLEARIRRARQVVEGLERLLAERA